MKLWEILVFICLLEGAKQVTAESIPSTETLREMTFECEDGWSIFKANCYTYEEYPLNLEEASYACMRQGGLLYYPENELEYFGFVSHYWPKKIWFGYVELIDEVHTLSNTEVPLESIHGWGLNQPDYSAGVGIAVSAEELLTITDSTQSLPFVCKHRACLQGYWSCDLASKCIKESQICDGNPDCIDKSDEYDCSQYGTTYTKTSDPNGSVDINIASGNNDRTWIIEVPLGSRIRIFIPSFNLQMNVGFLELLSGSPTAQYAEVLERITGSNTGHYLYSINNFVIVRFYSQGLSATSSTIRITWTTVIPDIPPTPTLLEASNIFQSLKIPFSLDKNHPAYLVLNWVIAAEEGKYITYYLEISPLTGNGIEDVSYEIYVEGRSIEHRNYYVSSRNEVHVSSRFVPKHGVATLKYRIGCGMDISVSYGYVHSPRPLIPNNLNCTWNFDGGKQAERGMTFRFTELDLTPDPRTESTVMSADKFSIDLKDGNVPTDNVGLFMSANDIIVAPSGEASVKFVSDVVLQSRTFVFMFGIDCESLELSEKTIMSTNVLYVNETVELSCPEGYKFNMEKYSSSSVNVVCRPNGWSLEDDESVCIPECQNCVGASCELVKDWCSDNPCENDGRCGCTEPTSYKCFCEPGYSGVNCQVVEDPCSSNPCKGMATCRSTPTDYICQCSASETWTGDSCKETNQNYSLLVNSYNYENSPSLIEPYTIDTNGISVFMRLRIHSFNPDNELRSLFTLLVTPDFRPYFNLDGGNDFYVAINDMGIFVAFNDIVVGGIEFDDIVMRKIKENTWHNIGVSITPDGILSATVDAVTEDSVKLGRTLNLTGHSAQHYLAYGFIAELRDVTVWNQVVSATEFVLATNDEYMFSKVPIQCWSNYVLTHASKVITETKMSKIQGDWTMISPQLNCSAIDDIRYTLAERITSLADIDAFAQTLEELKMDAEDDWTIEHTLPEALKNAYNPIVITATDRNMHYGECRGNLYVRYNEVCPDVVVNESVDTSSCTFGQGFCNIQCSDPGNVVPAPLPDYIQCGSLGVWDSRLPFSQLTLPSCVDTQPASYRVTVTMQYKLVISCANVFTPTTLESLANDINEIFLKLNDFWNNICDWNGQNCVNLDLSGAACESGTDIFNLKFSLTLASMEISAVRGGSMSTTEALEIIMLLEKNVTLNNYGGAVPLPDSFSIATMGTCPSGMYLSGDSCAPCSAGWFFNSESGMCDPCDYGKYQPGTGQTMCEKCDGGWTTYITGATSASDCKEKCLKGTKYDIDADECVVCPRHYYQGEDGKYFCYPCDIGFKTVLNGSDSEQDCKADCEAGKERDPDTGDCVPCSRGYWRSLIFDDCKPCPDNRTTLEGALGVSEDSCSMDICALGQFFNVLSMQCEDCDAGFFQDALYQLNCKPCSGNRTTRTERTINETDCLFYCTSGYSLGEAVYTCVPCERGSFKDNTVDKFGDCEPCDEGITTNMMAATSEANCSIPVCGQGEVISENVCEKCEMDSFSNVMSPDLSTKCMPCAKNYGTQQTGSNSTQCQRYCNAGSYLFEDDCKLCPRGTYKDAAGRFSVCMPCIVDTTTEEEGSTDQNNCSIPKCPAGSVIVDESCSDCPIDTYSDVFEPNSVIECIACNDVLCDVCMSYGTENEGTNNESLCLPTCPGGSYYSVESHSCELCQVGKYKPVSERFKTDCVECTVGFVTEKEGAMSVDECTLRDCEKGFKIAGENLDQCVVCPRGTFQNETRQDFCYSCGTNLNTDGDGKTSSDDCQISCEPGFHGTEECVPCKDGYIKSVEGFADCSECPIDTTSNAGHTVCDVVFCSVGKKYDPDNDQCLPCDIGSFKNTLGNDKECMECEAGTTTNGSGQAACTEPYCVPGKYLNNNDCVPCLNGTFKDAAGNDACTDCDAGFTTAEMGSESSTDCAIVFCPTGEYRDPSQTSLCTKCELNTYQSEAGKTSCEACDGEKITIDDGQTSVESCIPECKAGERFNDTAKICELCRPGTYKPTVGNTVDCTECPADKTTVGPGKTEETDCSQDVCNPGTHYVVRDNKVFCDPCEQGTYTDETHKASCTKCPDGNTTRYLGSSSADDCIDDCLIGYGYSTVNGECFKCPRGQYNDKKGTNPTVCKRCPEGKTNSLSGSSSCDFDDDTPVVNNAVDVFISLEFDIQIDNCDAGRAIDINKASIDNMIKQLFVDMTSERFNGPLKFCTDGCENIVSTLNGCVQNEQTSHSITLELLFKEISDFLTDNANENLEISTLECVTEIVILNMGALSDPGRGITFVKYLEAKYFDVCEPGEKSVGDTCVACEAGYYGEDSITCVQCPVNQYQNLEGQTSCETCPDNTFTESKASTSREDCIEICEAGNYFVSGTCVACPVGFYKTQSGNEAPCVSCPSGKTTTTTGGTSQNDCSENVCEYGQYFERDNNGVVQCMDCPIGTYSDMKMANHCKNCDTGTTTVLTKSTKKNQCVEICDPGFGISFPAKKCEVCKVGYYNDKQGSNPNMCKKCPEGFYTPQSGQSTCSQVQSGTAAPLKFIQIVVKVKFRVAIDSCSDSGSLGLIRSSISIRIRTLLTNRSNKFAKGRSFCENECINVFISYSLDTDVSKTCQAKSSTRRKRDLGHVVSLDVTLDNVPETVSDGIDELSATEVVSQILSTDDLSVDDNIVYESSEAPKVFPVCSSGQQVNPDDDATCASCSAGYYSDDDSNCKSCPVDTYQNETGQTACKECPTLTFNDDLASPSMGACRGYCEFNTQYCNSRGSCSETGRRSASCSCDEGFEGSKCESIVAAKCGYLETLVGGKQVTFYPVVVGRRGHSLERCYPGRTALATATCIGGYDDGVRWSNIMLNESCGVVPTFNQSESTKALQNISETFITPDNYLDIINDTVTLTDPAVNLTEADVIFTADIISDFLAFSPSNNEQILDDVYDIVNSVLYTQKDYLDSAQKIKNAANRIISSTDELTNEIALSSNEPVKIMKEFLAAVVLEQPGIGDLIIGIKLDETDSTTLKQGNISTVSAPTDVPLIGTDTAIYLTRKLTEGARTRLAFQLYSKTELFVVLNSRYKVNSKVVAARLTKGGKHIEALGDEIVTAVFSTLEYDENMVCAYWNYSASEDAGGWENKGCTMDTQDGWVVCKCNHLTNFAVLIDLEAKTISGTNKLVLGIITKVGLGISIICLAITIITFLVFKHLRRGRGQQVLINLSVAMMCSAILFLVGIDRKETKTGCIIVAALLHYFILVTFMWMLVEGVLQYLRFVKVLGTYIPNFMKKSMIPAWGFPLIPVIVILALDHNLYYGENEYCWLTWEPFLYGFLIPIAAIILVNLIVFTMVMSNLFCRRKNKGMASNQSERTMARLHLQAGLSILVILGLTWLFGFLTVDTTRIIFHYLFAIFNAFQGCFIFLLFTFREPQVRKAWKKLCCGAAKYKNTTSNTDSRRYQNGSTETRSTELSTNHRVHSSTRTQIPKP